MYLSLLVFTAFVECIKLQFVIYSGLALGSDYNNVICSN